MKTGTISKSTIKLLKNKTERMWIEDNKDINIFNYWFYRFFTNRYRNYLLWYFDFKEQEQDQE
jgi:hypothetical protein